MAPKPLLRIAWRSVRRNVRHSVGSVLAIAVGFVAIALSTGYLTFLYGENTERLLERFMMGHLLVERTRASEVMASGVGEESPTLGREEQAFIEEYLASRAGEVAARARLRYLWGLATTGKASTQFVAMGYDVEDGARLRGRFAWNALAGKPLDRAGQPDAVVLGRGLGSLLDCELASDRPTMTRDGLPIAEERPFTCRRPRVQLIANTEHGQLNAIEPEIVGIVDGGLREMDLKYAALPLPLAQRLLDVDDVSTYAVSLRDPSRAVAFARELTEAARAKGVDVVGTRWQDHALGEEQRRGTQVFNAFRALVAAVVVLIAGMSVLTTMARAVSERTREIGTLRSLGFLRRQVVALFALEAALLATLASGIGLVATLAVTAAVNAAGISYTAGMMAQPMPLEVALVPATYALAALFLAFVAALAAVLPARRAASRRIPDALTHT